MSEELESIWNLLVRLQKKGKRKQEYNNLTKNTTHWVVSLEFIHQFTTIYNCTDILMDILTSLSSMWLPIWGQVCRDSPLFCAHVCAEALTDQALYSLLLSYNGCRITIWFANLSLVLIARFYSTRYFFPTWPVTLPMVRSLWLVLRYACIISDQLAFNKGLIAFN